MNQTTCECGHQLRNHDQTGCRVGHDLWRRGRRPYRPCPCIEFHRRVGTPWTPIDAFVSLVEAIGPRGSAAEFHPPERLLEP